MPKDIRYTDKKIDRIYEFHLFSSPNEGGIDKSIEILKGLKKEYRGRNLFITQETKYYSDSESTEVFLMERVFETPEERKARMKADREDKKEQALTIELAERVKLEELKKKYERK